MDGFRGTDSLVLSGKPRSQEAFARRDDAHRCRFAGAGWLAHHLPHRAEDYVHQRTGGVGAPRVGRRARASGRVQEALRPVRENRNAHARRVHGSATAAHRQTGHGREEGCVLSQKDIGRSRRSSVRQHDHHSDRSQAERTVAVPRRTSARTRRHGIRDVHVQSAVVPTTEIGQLRRLLTDSSAERTDDASRGAVASPRRTARATHRGSRSGKRHAEGFRRASRERHGAQALFEPSSARRGGAGDDADGQVERHRRHAFARHVRARGSPKNSFKNMCTSPWGQRKRRRVHLEPFVPIRARKGGSTHGYARGGVRVRVLPSLGCVLVQRSRSRRTRAHFASLISHASTVEERRHHSRASQRRQAQTPVGKLGVVVTNSAVGANARVPSGCAG